MKYYILLIRHGMTKGNEEGRYIGQRTDESLSQRGIDILSEKKKEYQKYFKDEKYLIFSSPLKRCMESCQIIFNNSPCQIIDDFKEIDFGIFENKNYKELNGNAYYQRFIDSGGMTDYPEGEARSHFINRTKNAFYNVLNIMNSEKNNQAVIVCHGGSIMTILSELSGKDYFSFQVKNACGYYLELEMQGEEISEISYHCI